MKINVHFSLTAFSVPYTETLCELLHKLVRGCCKARGSERLLKLEVVILVSGRGQHVQECNIQGSENPPVYTEPLLELRDMGELFGTACRITCSHRLA
jgi:hypothetical protein